MELAISFNTVVDGAGMEISANTKEFVKASIKIVFNVKNIFFI